ncbi:MAG TPA: oxygenase MpaB family protein [Solirubrobacterales bacterium]|nr:oxygenase MpaB family protein [Solirubrobacterales bacterium]
MGSAKSKWTTGAATRRRISRLDPMRDDEEITRLVSETLYGDPFFAHTVFLVTFTRQACVPGIAKVLYRSGNGDVITEPRRRNDDTIVFFSEFFRRGYKSDDGRAAIARMENIHSNFLIDDELKLYTLATVMFEPERLARQFDCDPFSAIELEGRWNFWRGFAAAIPLELPVDDREGFIAWMEDYERRSYRHTVDAAGIFEALIEDWMRWFPTQWPLSRWIARQSLIGLLDEHTRETVQVEPAHPVFARLVRLVARTYLFSTPFRIMRSDRRSSNYFGRNRPDPQDLDNVGYQPRNLPTRDGRAERV